ncbi:putative gustatory receptor 2a [Diorhabda sublineata]|uniref:putative gustatory receptor 2a n=1 Tax=Diorhabda sublineata TaxID=1163346 RepID=UPI0024E1750F|nr:putative gustatory receptor 2a [Diorhabda sublineata]
MNFVTEIDPKKNVVIQAGDILNGISSIIAAVGSILTGLLFENRITMVIKKLYDIDSRLRNHPRWINYDLIRRFAYACIICTFNSWIYFLISYMLICSKKWFICFGSWVLLFSITKIFDVNLIRFVIHMSLIWHKLCVVNINITQLSKERITYPNSLSSLKEIQKINTLESLKELYEDILNIGEELSSIYSFSLLLIITNQFVSIFSSLYNCFFGYYIDGEFIQPNSIQDLLVPLLSLIHPGGQLLATTIICQLTISECKRTGKLIFRIPVTRTNKTLIKRINFFSLHILHKKFDITACGFFDINCSLLLSIVGAVTVYLVTFIQFDLAARKQMGQ